jgi:hypothetical protein
MRSPWYLCVYEFLSPPPHNFWILEEIKMKFGMYIVASEPMKAAYLINPSRQSVCLYVYPSIVARQRLGTNVTAAIEELLDASFYMRFMSY